MLSHHSMPPRHNPFTSLCQHRDLLLQFAWRMIEQRHRGSFLGLAWSLLTPLMMLGLYSFVFGYVFQSRFHHPGETRTDYVLGIFLGLTLFHFLAEILAQGPTLIVSQPNFVKKVVFPLEVLPAAAVTASAFSAGISLLLALLGVALLGPGLRPAALYLAAIIPPVLLLGLGLAWFLAALGVFVRDITNAIAFLAQVLLYSSAVFYPLSLIPPVAWAFLRFNPLLHAVESTRRVLLWHEPPAATSLLFLWLAGLVVCLGGYFAFRRVRPAFADVI